MAGCMYACIVWTVLYGGLETERERLAALSDGIVGWLTVVPCLAGER
jgi:hypothetical protein